MAPITPTCPAQDDLLLFLDGNLTDGRFEELAAHLVDCKSCERLCQEVEGVLQQGGAQQDMLQELRLALQGTVSDLDAGDVSTLDVAGSIVERAARNAKRASDEDVPVGMLLGSYRVLEHIGQGGMGCVVRARHEMLGRLVAIKIPFRRILSSPEGQQRFLREARAASKLQHANICPVYEAGELQGRPFLVMAFIPGQTLAVWKRDHKPSARESARIVAAMARGVAQAHAQGIIHRDIKPANVMIEEGSGRPILTDFGLARDAEDIDESLTATGQLMGTPVYMAPEQAAGATAEVGVRTDIYGLGAVLYELLTNRPPFQGAIGDVIRAVQVDLPPLPRKLVPTVHRDLETICLRAMKKIPAERYPSASALADDLERFCAGEAIWARPDTWWQKATRIMRRRRAALLATAALVAICAALVGFFARSAAETRRAAELARSLETGLQSSDWDAEKLTRLHDVAAELRQLEPRHESASPQRIEAALANYIQREWLARPRFQSADAAQTRRLLDLLTARDPTTAAQLQERLAGRLREWQPVLTLGPFDAQSPLTVAKEDSASSDLLVQNGLLVRPEPAAGGHDKRAPAAYFPAAQIAGNVRLKVVFQNAWRGGDQVGLVFATTDRHRYTFRLSPLDDEDQELTARRAFRTAPCLLELERDGVLLRGMRLSFSSSQQSVGRLTLIATYEDRRLSLQVQDQAAVEFTDLLALPQQDGQFTPGVLLPPGAAIQSLVAEQQALPRVPSALERGDRLFARGKYSDALTEYRLQQNLSTVSPQVRDELVLKEALCLDALNQTKQAAGLLAVLRRSPDQLVRAAAMCRLWLIYLRSEQDAEAGVLFAELGEQDVDDLSRLIPEAERNAIADKIFKTGVGLDMLYVSPQSLESLRRANLLRAAVWGGQHNEGMRLLQLARGFHAAGAHDEAIRLLKPVLAQRRPDFGGVGVDLFEEYAWVMRTTNDLTLAAEETERQLERGGDDNDEVHRLLLERARQHAARQNWVAALADIDSFLQKPVSTKRYFYYSSAYLMRGFCLRRLGREAEVQAAWCEGLCSRWREVAKIRDADLILTGLPLENALLLGMLTKQVSADELAHLIRSSTIAKELPAVAIFAAQFGRKIVPILNGVCGDPLAVGELERLAFQQVTLAEYLRAPVCLAGIEAFRQTAGVPLWNAEERAAIRQFWNEALDYFGQGKLRFSHFAQGFAAWEGITGELGWQGLARDLPPNLRGPLAYIIGLRLVGSDRPADAQTLFSVAQGDLPPASALRPHLQRAQKKLLPPATP